MATDPDSIHDSQARRAWSWRLPCTIRVLSENALSVRVSLPREGAFTSKIKFQLPDGTPFQKTFCKYRLLPFVRRKRPQTLFVKIPMEPQR